MPQRRRRRQPKAQIFVNVLSAVEQTIVNHHHGNNFTNTTNIIDSNVGAVGGGILQDQVNPGQNVENDGRQADATDEAETVKERKRPDVRKKNSSLQGASKVHNRSTGSNVSPNTADQLSTATVSNRRTSQIRILKERCEAYMWRKNPDYTKAYKLLEILSALQQENNFNTKLKLAECYIYLDMWEKRDQAAYDLTFLISSQAVDPDSVFALGVDLLESSAYIRALLAFMVTDALYLVGDLSPDDLVSKFFDIALQTQIVIKAMIHSGDRLKGIGLDTGIDILNQIYSDLDSLEKCDLENKDVKLTEILELLGAIYKAANKIEKSLEQRHEAVDLLETKFGTDGASKRPVYRRLLADIGANYAIQKKTVEAKEYREKSLTCRM